MLFLTVLEWTKMRRSGFFKVLLLFMAIGTIGYYIYIYSNTVRTEEILSNLEVDLMNTELQLVELEKQDQNGSLDQPSKNVLKIYHDSVPQLKAQIEGINTGNWVMWAKANREFQKFDTSFAIKQEWERTYPTRFTQDSHQSFLEWLEQRNIEPVWPMYFWLTSYDEVFDEGIEPIIRGNVDKRHGSNGSYFSYHLFNHLFTFIGIVFFLFLFNDIITKEGEGRNGPINLLRTLPINRNAVLLSKFISVLLMTIGILAVVLILATFLGTLFDRFGDWNYPILIYGENYAFEWIPLGLFLLKSAGLFLLGLVFSYSILFFFSVLTNRAIISIGITLTLLFLGNAWAEQSILSENAHLIPFHYLNVYMIVSNDFAVIHDNFAFSYTNGVLSLTIASLAILLMTYVLSIFRYRTRG